MTDYIESCVETLTIASNAASHTVNHKNTFLSLGTLADAATITLTPGKGLPVGARAILTWTEPATAAGVAIKHDTGDADIAATATKGANSATVNKEVVWNGTKWLLV